MRALLAKNKVRFARAEQLWSMHVTIGKEYGKLLFKDSQLQRFSMGSFNSSFKLAGMQNLFGM